MANSEARKENSQKKVGTKRHQNYSNNWKEVLQIYEDRIQIKNKQKANRILDSSPEQIFIYDELLKNCSNNPQAFRSVESPQQEIVTLHDNGVKGNLIPYTQNDEQEIKKHIEELLTL